MKSKEEFDAFWRGALIWSDPLVSDDDKTARTRAYFGLEFQCRHAFRGSDDRVHCFCGGDYCLPDMLLDYMEHCSYFAQMPCNLSEILKAQSLASQATMTQEPRESVCSKATVTSECIGEEYHEV